MDENCNICGDTSSVSLTSRERKLVELRYPEKDKVFNNLCKKHHTAWVGSLYSSRFKACANPIGEHKKEFTSQLSIISLDDYYDLRTITSLIPGQKMCKKCFATLCVPKNCIFLLPLLYVFGHCNLVC